MAGGKGEWGEAFGAQVAELVKSYVDGQVDPLRKRVTVLEKGGAKKAATGAGLDLDILSGGLADIIREEVALQVKKHSAGMTYRGVWQRAQSYDKGAVVTDGGSAWVALRASESERPGASPQAWQLMAKGGA